MASDASRVEEIDTMGDGQADITAVAALLARRWKEDRPYFTLHGFTQDIALSSWWQRRCDYAELGAARASLHPRTLSAPLRRYAATTLLQRDI